ncbi:TadE/TadG family type IV pilus assembly protein [Paenibacillus solisilvae]|uniref:TadE/TadG family type IV pilus assembly protein n=1 Tax=Paenibacillus solisilvae TaxID=2486751 RepID=A0ABW0VS81_9BACL
MKSLIKRLVRLWPRGDEGSFTVESSIVFPAIFFALLAVIIFSMYTYQKVVLYHSASLSAERAAFRWDNSKREVLSGIGITGQYDGLYWRMSGNGALQSLFGWGSSTDHKGGTVVQIGGGSSQGEITRRQDIQASGDATSSNNAEASLPAAKMNRIIQRIPEPFEGQMSYEYGLLEKTIVVKLLQPVSIGPLEAMLGASDPKAVGHVVVVDPVEGIRNVDLVRYYTAKFGQSADGKAKQQQASEVLSKRRTLEVKR